MAEKFLIWWTSQEDCERIVPLETWPMYSMTNTRAAKVATVAGGCGATMLAQVHPGFVTTFKMELPL